MKGDMHAYPDIQLDFKLAPKTDATVFLNPKVEPLSMEQTGPFVRNAKGELVCIEGRQAFISADEGETWQAVPLFSQEGFDVQDTHSLCTTQSGVLVLGFLNMGKVHFNWVNKTNKPTKNTFLALWTVRSLDGGHSWEAPVCVQTGYCGATTTLIQLSSGELLLAAQNLDYENGRHYSLTYRSEDEGISWQPSNLIDIGGQGHHDGCYEGTLVELQDKRVWYLIRTNRDWFWNAFSEDQGRTWTQLEKGMPASSSPGMLCRLKSGHLMLAYNQLYAQGQSETRRVSGQFSEREASWQREELSVRFSRDDGKTWTAPEVIAQCDGAWLSYSYLFEVVPGVIWLTTMQSHLKLCVRESDFIA